MASITTSAPARKASRKPARSLRYFDGTPGLLELTVGGVRQDYWLSEIQADWGRAFEVRKPLPDGTVYHVHLDPEMGDTCDCLGHLRHGHRTVCKHVAAVKALIARGELPPAAPRPAALPAQPMCAVCHACPVDAEGGYDTCDDCLARQ
jgi:hypothetical protein